MTNILEEPAAEQASEMDEFFNFEGASTSHSSFSNNPNGGTSGLDLEHTGAFGAHSGAEGPYDIDLIFASTDNDENSFTALEHFSSINPEPYPGVQNFDFDAEAQFEFEGLGLDTTMMTPDDFTDFPRWIDGMDVPTNPCAYCRRMKTHCKIIYEGLRKGSCTSCVALARSCSLTMQYAEGDEWKFSNGNGERAKNGKLLPWIPVDGVKDPCEYCRTRGLQCVPVDQGEGKKSCANCIAFACPCTFNNFRESFELWTGGKTIAGVTPPISPLGEGLRKTSTPGLMRREQSEEELNGGGAKVGARFSRESLKILKSWLGSHANHPYPSDEEKESLRRQTGLSKQQITNWLANARRRGKVRAPRSTSPSVRNYPNAMDIPRRSGTPALESMNPLERWKHSPPENEPASVTAIARAVTSSTFSSGLNSPHTSHGLSDDGSARSIANVSSTSSLGTSQSSGGSFASAFSYRSHGSLGSFGSFGNRGRRRRRKAAPKPAKLSPALHGALARTYQCTFCTETFKTKHDWQRHEKSLHLSLERWVCCPTGPSQFCADYNHNRCVFCGLPNPSEDHCETHNYSSCAERALEERTFYRKDHLRQHLNLVHDVKFQSFSMETWKVITPEIRSRCGFCGVVMDSWSFRVDHLAEHFKDGKSMADWKGDWGFEPQVLDIVENGMPPYLIHDERNSMNPFEASKETAGDEKTLEDLIKIGLVEYIHNRILQGKVPTDDELLLEARKVLHKSDELFANGKPDASWFRDLILFSTSTEEEALNSVVPSNPWANSDTVGCAPGTHDHNSPRKSTCSKECALHEYVRSRQALGLTPTDRELQIECCKILTDTENISNCKCKGALSWFKYLVTSSPTWLVCFRRRAGLPRSSELLSEAIRSTDDKSIDYSINNHARLEKELKDWCRLQLSIHNKPSDEEIQRKARLIAYKNDDPWNQTAVDDPAFLLLLKRQIGLATSDDHGVSVLDLPTLSEHSSPSSSNSQSPRTLHWDLENNSSALTIPPSQSPSSGSSTSLNNANVAGLTIQSPQIVEKFGGLETGNWEGLQMSVLEQPSTNTNPTQPLKYFLNDANCYGRLVRQLSRFVTSCMSVNNPNRHIPTDSEIQNQARWIIYDDDDPWNQTAADNAEWLIRFKRDVNLLPPSQGPGLPDTAQPGMPWKVSQGGTGFAAPYLWPGPKLADGNPEVLADNIAPDFTVEGEGENGRGGEVKVRVEHKVYSVKKKTAGLYLKGLRGRYERPGRVFCSRELEVGLTEFVETEKRRGRTPTDEVLRKRARAILGVADGGRTAADEDELLIKFKDLVGIGKSVSGLPFSSASMDSTPAFGSITTISNPQSQSQSQNAQTEKEKENQAAANTLSDFDAQLLAEFDKELEGMDFSQQDILPMTLDGRFSASIPEPISPVPMDGVEVMGDMRMEMGGGSVTPNSQGMGLGLGMAPLTQPTSISLLGESLGHSVPLNGTGTGMGMSPPMPSGDKKLQPHFQEGLAKDYAEMFRVSSATASPLRRRASMKVAGQRFGGPPPLENEVRMMEYPILVEEGVEVGEVGVGMGR